jgi:hypothetical protein
MEPGDQLGCKHVEYCPVVIVPGGALFQLGDDGGGVGNGGDGGGSQPNVLSIRFLASRAWRSFASAMVSPGQTPPKRAHCPFRDMDSKSGGGGLGFPYVPVYGG